MFLVDRRKQEIAAKRAKLEELRKAREARSALSSAVNTRPASTIENERPSSSRAQLDDLVSSLLGAHTSGGPAAPGTHTEGSKDSVESLPRLSKTSDSQNDIRTSGEVDHSSEHGALQSGATNEVLRGKQTGSTHVSDET